MAKPTSIVALAVDGLRASALGAYGNTWYATPALDRLAADAWVFDQSLATHPGLASNYQALFPTGPSKPDPLRQLSDQGYDLLLVTDDPDAPGEAIRQRFDRIAIAPEVASEDLAVEADQTATATTLALMLDQVEPTSPEAPLFAWTHLRFTGGPWDAPLAAIEPLLGEDDPSPVASTTPPAGECERGDDAAFGAAVRYAAQVIALDQCLGVLPGVLDGLLGVDQYVLILLGLRGFALGEHGYVGIDDARPYNELRHTPLVVRHPGSRAHQRSGRLLRPADVTRVLGSPPLEYAGLGVDAVRLHGSAGAARQDTHWKLYLPRDGEPELYSKPDDRWEANDVASRHLDLIDELAGPLLNRNEDLAEPTARTRD